jgi:hypothetical protein
MRSYGMQIAPCQKYWLPTPVKDGNIAAIRPSSQRRRRARVVSVSITPARPPNSIRPSGRRRQ